ncbi:hypothetical protein [Streptomyces sp. WAC 04229]|uniref:hypothetical protein n=1 Tax=Streptomyces sp. WAC 04229 TaxID=2203206 RepID=UPI00163CB83F|nr:hypothetical protein [Streptomyces sp. WAC 04229]
MTDTLSTEYVQPEDRPAAWADMASDLAACGRTHAQIAAELCIDEPTVFTLLAGSLR